MTTHYSLIKSESERRQEDYFKHQEGYSWVPPEYGCCLNKFETSVSLYQLQSIWNLNNEHLYKTTPQSSIRRLTSNPHNQERWTARSESRDRDRWKVEVKKCRQKRNSPRSMELRVIRDIKGMRGRQGCWGGGYGWKGRGLANKETYKSRFPALHSKQCKCESVCSSRGKILLSTWRFILCKSSWTEPGFCLYLWPHFPRPSGSPRLGTLSFSISTFMNLKWPILLCKTPFHRPLLFICTTSIMSPFCNKSHVAICLGVCRVQTRWELFHFVIGKIGRNIMCPGCFALVFITELRWYENAQGTSSSCGVLVLMILRITRKCTNMWWVCLF